ncbi:MAG: hypothetical protein ABS36_05850 [Acidobacteria bacterium SCN 69-37]|nr:MAG: hypothetical protein ABS36_05850 [Acidobacteria bacterium SCN 69-37]
MTAHALGSLEARLARGETATREDVASLCRGQDLVSIGVIGDLVRQACTGTRVTYGRVLSCEGDVPDAIGQAGEVRLVGTPASIDDARRRVRAAVARAGGRVVTGFSLADLVSLAGDDRDRLRGVAADLAQDGLVAVAEVAIDRAISDAAAIAQVQAVRAGGLETWRLTIDDAEGLDVRMALIERARAVQEATGAVRAFAPLPRRDPRGTPSTGYDDVKTVAAARVRCPDIEVIQIDWPLYGPKLAQVALTFGAGDLDGISPYDTSDLGPRRAPVEDIHRQIRAAGGEPVERDATYRPRG